MGRAYLLTGKPQVGKTRAIKQIVDGLGKKHCGGFYTEEIRVQGARTGFQLVTLDGQHVLFAHTDVKSAIRVGRFGICLDSLEAVGITVLYKMMETNKLIVIDEIGLMQVHSEQFKRAVLDVLKSPLPLLGTISLQPHPWLDQMKQQETVRLYELMHDNYDDVVRTLIVLVRAELQEG
jgi:nucleoside-triphosphatase